VNVGGRWWWTTAALLTVFLSARALLVTYSYDSVANWEEPVFLFSGVDLGEQGLSHLFDYQDDLSHGGSLPLVLIATPWVRLVGWRLDALKGIAVLWSAATVLALLAVGARFVSLRFAVLLALLYAASPYAAMLQVTLVGSHPEAALFMVIALAAYLRTLEPGHDGGAAAVLLGTVCALATWCSYLTAPFTVPLGAFYVARRPRHAAVALAGAVIGFTPWLIQNVVLRPHGAMQWTQRAAQHPASQPQWNMLARTAESLAGDAHTGFAVLALLIACAAWAMLASWRTGRRSAVIALQPGAILPVAFGALLSLAALAAAKPSEIPGEGFYYFRYFVPLQLTLFWLAALGIEELTRRLGHVVFYGAVAAILAFSLVTQLPLYRGSNSYVPDREHDFEAGCAVYGHAEVDRAASDEDAVARLETFAGAGCKRAAFTGYGWGVVSRYTRDGDGALLAASLDAIRDPALRAGACASARRLMTNLYEGAMSQDRRHTGALYIESTCARGVEKDDS
jgi:hypothetical protein